MEKIKHGSRFGSNLSIMALFTLGLGIYLLTTENYLGGTIISFISLVVAFEPAGIEIDLANSRIREYQYYCFIKMGKWKNLGDYVKLKIQRDRDSNYVGVMGGRHTYTHDSFDVFLIHKNDH